MSTIQPPRTAADPQVLHPLDRLRGTIRRYVVIEGVLSAALFLSLWFALGLLLDFVLFKATGWDWVQDGPRALRGSALVLALGLFALLLYLRIARRLATEFSYPALALVLERKFPLVLGDRLITAVELADVEAMAKFGYSAEMIRATIAEARERVARVPVDAVFNWRRLWVLGALAVLVPAGTVAAGYAGFAAATGSGSPSRFAWKFWHTAGVFAERNVALLNTPWPRRAHVELVDFPESGELTFGRDAAEPPRVKARAFRWVIADRAAPAGWRPLLWADVAALTGRPVPPLPAGRTVDELDRVLTDPDDAPAAEFVSARDRLMTELGTGNFGVAQEAFKALRARAAEPSSGRTVRHLDPPAGLTYRYRGRKISGTGELTLAGGVYVAEVTDKERKNPQEEVAFVVRAEDFATPPKRIRPIPPPTLKRLYREQAEPAYLHHAPPAGATFEALKGRLQKMAPRDLSLTGDRTVFAVPAGTELTIGGEAYAADDGTVSDNDRIVSAVAVPASGRFPGTKLDAQGRPTQEPVPLAVAPDGSSFALTFAGAHRVTEKVEFKVEFANRYGVTATRAFVVQVVDDAPPAVEVAVDVIRKVGNVYLVTPRARIPFNPDSFVKDDRGLQKVVYGFTYWAEDSDVVRALRAKFAARALLDVPLPGSGPAAVLPLKYAENFRFVDRADSRQSGAAFLGLFEEQQRALPRDTEEAFRAALEARLPDDPTAADKRAVRKLELNNPNRDYFDLKVLGDSGVLAIAAKSNEDVQTVYRMDLTVEATDTNVDHAEGPRVARNAEPIRLRIVSESDLLIEIGKEEDALALKLDDALVKLATAKKKYEFVRSANGFRAETPDQVDAVKVRAQDAVQDVEKARDLVQGVGREYRRLTRECEINRLNDEVMKRLTAFTAIVEAILADDPNVPLATFPKTQTLLLGVQNVLNAGRWAPLAAVSDAENSIYALERRLQEIRAQLGEAQNKDKLKKALLAIKEQQARIRDQVLAWKRDEEDKLNSPTPTIGPVGALALSKGEAKKVQHKISWNQYKEDDLVVKVTASDPALTVPGELKLNYETHQFAFEYEVKAGAREGTYKVTLAPAVGKPVEVLVVVK